MRRFRLWALGSTAGGLPIRGSSWLYLDTIRKKVLWLSQAWEPERPEADADRSIPAGLRFRVLRRDNYTCRYCGAAAPEVPLHVDHVVPWVEVRCQEVMNLVAAFQDCMFNGRAGFADYGRAEARVRNDDQVPRAVIRPYALNDKPATGRYTVIGGRTAHFAKPIPRPDVAKFFLDCVEDTQWDGPQGVNLGGA